MGNKGGVNGAVNHGVRHVDALGAELARHALGQRAQRMLGAGKCAKARSPAQAGRGAGENNRSSPPCEHGLGHFTAEQKARQRSHFPDLAVHALGGVHHRKAHIGPDIENRRLDRRDIGLDALHQFDHRRFDARIRAKSMGAATFGFDLRHQRL